MIKHSHAPQQQNSPYKTLIFANPNNWPINTNMRTITSISLLIDFDALAQRVCWFLSHVGYGMHQSVI